MEESNPRLGVEDKRHLHRVLLAMTERLFYLNKFPVDQQDFALSLQSAEVEAAWTLITKKITRRSTAPVSMHFYKCNDTKWQLHMYPGDDKANHAHDYGRCFMNVSSVIDIDVARRHLGVVKVWCARQARLEEQMLRSARVIKSIVHACNTVGQYKRVSPDLLGFLPEKYALALRDYTKASPYPQMSATKQEIDTTLSTLAFAALQPEHHSEEKYTNGGRYRSNHYSLEPFPRSQAYDGNEVRKLNI